MIITFSMRLMKYLLVPGWFLIFLSYFFSALAFSATHEIYSFASRQEKIQFQQIIQELRCLVCQNQNLADSNAPLAQDLRRIIYQRIKKGESSLHIKNYLVSRYGEFILFKPMFYPLTYALWLSPFILLLAIGIKLLVRTRGFEPPPTRKADHYFKKN